MFPSPPKTLIHSLSNVLTDAQHYSADVCFVFDNEQQVWAHRALLLARVPEETIRKLMPQLFDVENTSNALITISDISTMIPYSIFVNLLRFWYTADFSPPKTQPSSSTPSIVSTSTTTSSSSSPTELVSHALASDMETLSAIRHSIEQKFQLQLLPRTTEGLSDDDQLAADLASMRRNQLNCDITVNIFMPITTSSSTTKKKKKKQVPKSRPTPTPTPVKRHTTPEGITISTSTKDDSIISILNTTPKTTKDDDDGDDDSDDDDGKTNNPMDMSSPKSSSATIVSFPVHRCILASRSSYFRSLLYDHQDSNNTPSLSSVLLTSDLFSPLTLDIILHYFYTDQLQIPDVSPSEATSTSASTMSVFQKEMNRKKHRLRELQKVFCAADYLGLTDSLCKAVLHEMESICHRFQCTCSSCVVLLPSMMAFANKQVQQLPLLRSTLMAMYTDPIQAFPPLWSQKPFSLLILAHMAQPIDEGASLTLLPSSLQSLFQNNNNGNNSNNSNSDIQTAPPSSAFLVDLISMTLENITKRNAVHVLHSIHLCLSKIRSADPLPTWSQASLAMIHAFLHHTLAIVTLDFNYYCVDYPILLSCVDGIGGGFSVDFLDFLLKRVLSNGIQDSNAAVLYQGIVRDLIGRQQVVKNVAVDGVLLDARRQCVEYLSHRWVGVKAQGAFQPIDKDILRLIAEDINVPYRTLSKPMESEFSTKFGFKSKSDKQLKSLESTESTETTTAAAGDWGFRDVTTGTRSRSGISTLDMTPSPTSKSRRRLSLNALRHARLPPKNCAHHRHSVVEVNGWMDSSIEDNQRSLSDNEANSLPDQHSSHRHISSKHHHHHHHHYQHQINYPAITRTSSKSSLTDILLPVDTPISNLSLSPPPTTSSPNYHRNYRGKSIGNNNKEEDVTIAATTTSTRSTGKLPRKSRLTFELPELPIRTKLSIRTSSNGSSTRHKYRWGGLKSGSKESGSDSGDDNDDDHHHQVVVAALGAKVELLRRPLPTLGRIKYIGHVQFSKGTWVGVELESRLGQNDGSVDGVRYFQTDPQRGVFVKSDGLKLISGPS